MRDSPENRRTAARMTLKDLTGPRRFWGHTMGFWWGALFRPVRVRDVPRSGRMKKMTSAVLDS